MEYFIAIFTLVVNVIMVIALVVYIIFNIKNDNEKHYTRTVLTEIKISLYIIITFLILIHLKV